MDASRPLSHTSGLAFIAFAKEGKNNTVEKRITTERNKTPDYYEVLQSYREMSVYKKKKRGS